MCTGAIVAAVKREERGRVVFSDQEGLGDLWDVGGIREEEAIEA